jgi:hypothetical protein
LEFPAGSGTKGMLIYRLTDTGWECIGGETKNGSLAANISTGGTFRVGLTGGSDQTDTPLPGQIMVEQNVPNPFNGQTIITFVTPSTMVVKVSVYDLLGRLVRQFDARQYPAGRTAIRWNAMDDRGNSVSTGMYILSINGGGKTVTRKMLYIR